MRERDQGKEGRGREKKRERKRKRKSKRERAGTGVGVVKLMEDMGFVRGKLKCKRGRSERSQSEGEEQWAEQRR